MEQKKYPIGRYRPAPSASARDVARWIDEIESLPEDLSKALAGMSEEQLDTPYREGGWTVRQLVHHIADSHLNAYVRIKLTLTEERPTITAYDQDRWAALSDSRLPVEVSLRILGGLHERWVSLMKSLEAEQLERKLIHPESGTLILKSMIGLYAWHGKHHLAHIASLKEEKNWS